MAEYILKDRLNELMFYNNNMSSAQLAGAIEVSVQTVNAWKRGAKLMTLKNLIKTADILKCSLDFLVGRSDTVLNYTPQVCPDFYQNLRQVMKNNGISRYKLTKETAIKDSYLYLWKNGSDVKIPALIELADYLNITIDTLVGRER